MAIECTQWLCFSHRRYQWQHCTCMLQGRVGLLPFAGHSLGSTTKEVDAQLGAREPAESGTRHSPVVQAPEKSLLVPLGEAPLLRCTAHHMGCMRLSAGLGAAKHQLRVASTRSSCEGLCSHTRSQNSSALSALTTAPMFGTGASTRAMCSLDRSKLNFVEQHA